MKIIHNLKAEARDGDHHESRGILSAVHDEPRPGVHRQVMLGADGLIFKRAHHRAAIPLAELWALAEAHEPNLKP